MKKALYGTTALVAAGALMASPASAEEKIKLGLGGYYNLHFGVGSTDTDSTLAGTTQAGIAIPAGTPADTEATNVRSEGEVWFKGETTLDNGITFGANIQLEGTSQFGGDTIDEAYGYVSGSFGRILIGSENSAAYLMHYSAPGVGVPVNSGWVSTFVPTPAGFRANFRTPAVSTNVDLGLIGNDERVITYFTPRFSGFQVGATYTPAFSGSGDGQQTAAFSEAQFQHGISVGVNYVQTFNDLDIAVSGGYRMAQPGDLTDDAKGDAMDQWSAGINVGFAGFTVGGSFALEDDDYFDVFGWDVGATYSTGPWTVGVTYFASEIDEVRAVVGAPPNQTITTVPFDQDYQALSAGIAYAVGPGIEAQASILWADYDMGTNANGNQDADGVVAIVGLTYSF